MLFTKMRNTNNWVKCLESLGFRVAAYICLWPDLRIFISRGYEHVQGDNDDDDDDGDLGWQYFLRSLSMRNFARNRNNA
jgi:hypothetical protein